MFAGFDEVSSRLLKVGYKGSDLHWLKPELPSPSPAGLCQQSRRSDSTKWAVDRPPLRVRTTDPRVRRGPVRSRWMSPGLHFSERGLHMPV